MNIETVAVSSRFDGDQKFTAAVSVFGVVDPGDGRLCMAIYTGCATLHIHMTPSEVERLASALLAGIENTESAA